MLGFTGVNTLVRGTLEVDEAASFNDDLDVDGHTTLDQVSVVTNDGPFNVTGSNGFDVNISAPISLDAVGNSNFNTTSGNLTLGGDITYLGGVVTTQNTTNAVTYNNAPFMVTGGAGFAKDVYMNQKLDAQGPVYLGTFGNTTTVRGTLSVAQNLAAINIHALGTLTVVSSSLFQGVVTLNNPTDIVVGNFSSGALLIPTGGVSIGGSLQVQGGLFGQLGNSSNCLSAYIDSINLCGTLPLVVTGSGGLKLDDGDLRIEDDFPFIYLNATTDNNAGIVFEEGGSTSGWLVYNTDNNYLKLVGGSSSTENDLVILSNGNVGIGLSDPSEELEVDGDIGISGNLKLDSSPTTGFTSGTIGEGNVTGSVVFSNALYVASDGEYEKADADGASTMPCIALALGSGTGTQDILFHGFITNSSWSWTVGGEIYVSTTAGGLTQTVPSGIGDEVQIVGIAISATTFLFDPDLTTVTIAP